MAARLLTLVLALFFFIDSYGTHLLGSHISYNYLGNDRYELVFTFYRDCQEIALSNPSSASSIYCKDSNRSESLDLVLRSIEDITPYNDPSLSGCDPQNTTGTGVGIEKIIYIDTVDLNDAKYSFLKSCCEIYIQSGQCCRPSGINTGSANYNHFNKATIYYCNAADNSLADVSQDIYPEMCCNQPVHFNAGIMDHADGDSLSFAFGEPLSARNSSIQYTGLYYGYDHPLQVYYPGNLQPPYYDHVASPPIGLFLDPETGELIYTPTRCDEVTTVVIVATEWRRNSSGAAVKVGEFRYDNIFKTKTCPSNNPPEISGDRIHFICPDKTLCFDIETSDERVILPPPNPVPDHDTVSIGWNNAIQGGVFTVLNPDSINQKARFCWTPDSSDIRGAPYSFVVEASDNFEPFQNRSYRTFKISVGLPIVPNITRSDDTLFSSLSPVIWYKNGVEISGNNSDTLVISDTGRYSARYSDTNGCESGLSEVISKTLGIPVLTSSDLQIYPNPTAGTIQLDVKAGTKIYSIEIMDISGRTVNSNILREGDHMSINWQGADGLYILKINSDRGILYSKVLKGGN